mmetsp:Transcript_18969/g.21437  ORF Transcript_18969/g.21437 Transcript_18969/m.21437 type:complete len:871 (+) Transcript_18969:38-2650(+)
MTLFSNSNTQSTADNDSFGGLASLPNLGGGPLTRPTWKRSLQELAASNIALMGNNNGSGLHHATSAVVAVASNVPSTSAAQMLLGSRIDFGSLISSNTSTTTTTNRGTYTSGKFNQNQNQENDNAARFSYDAMNGGGIEEVVRRHRDGMLERILKDQRGETQRLLDKAVERQIEEDWEEERTWWRKELVGDRNLVDATNINTHNIGGKVRDPRFDGESNFSTPRERGLLITEFGDGNRNTSGSSFATGCDPKAMKDHLEIVKRTQETSDLKQAIADFERLARDSSNGYHNAWLLLGCMIPSMQNPINGAQGALSHFCRQYQRIINNHVKSASLSGQDISTSINYGGCSAMAEMIASYVKLTSGSNASVWEILYYCLRCGDAQAAKVVLDVTPYFSEQPIVSHILNQLSQRQGAAYCMFEVGSPMISSGDRFDILNLYEKSKNLETNSTHKLGVLALLCGQRLESFSTVEDYLFGCLWLALLDKEDPVRQIETIGASIRKYGPSHFAADGSGEWGYVLPLIASQQFETALSYLAEAGGPTGLMQAVHLGIVFILAQVNVADLGNSSSSSRGSSSKDVVNTLLVNYATFSEREPSARVLASLAYLIKISNHEEMNYQIANLIYRSQSEELTGVLDSVGNRIHAILDDILPSRDEVSTILVAAADLFKKEASDRTKAQFSAKLYMLGYRHTKLVQLLNESISPVNISDENKIFWTQQSKLFFDSYLSKRSSVVESIEREGKLNLIDTNQILIELRSFFDRYRQRQFLEAFEVVKNTGLLPLTQEDLNEKTSKFRDLDPILKEQFPTVLSAGVECLCEMFQRLKSESRGIPPAVGARLNELHFLARYLFLFAGLINMPSTCKNDIARMRANMIF